MSRCSDMRRTRAGQAARIGLLTATVLVSLTPAAAAGRVAGHQLTAAAPAADPVDPADARVLDIEAPVLDIALSTADMAGQARVEELPKRTRVTLDSTISFGKDSAVLLPAATRRLAEIAAQLRAKGPGSVDIVGYTDDLGSAAHGQQLSEQRARAVANALRTPLPAADFRFTVSGMGEADPAVPNDSEANRRINRRVELVYVAH